MRDNMMLLELMHNSEEVVSVPNCSLRWVPEWGGWVIMFTFKDDSNTEVAVLGLYHGDDTIYGLDNYIERKKVCFTRSGQLVAFCRDEANSGGWLDFRSEFFCKVIKEMS